MLATDLGARLQDLRRALGWTQEQLADEVGRRPNAVSEWERDVRKPPPSLLARLCRNHDWPEAIFEEGGPMPSTIVNRPARARSTPPTAKGRAHRYFVTAMRELMDDVAEGRSVSPEAAMGYLGGLWNEATREAPQLMKPAAGDGSGNQNTGDSG